MPESPETLQIERIESGWRLSGEIDAATAPQLATALDDNTGADGDGDVVFDVEEITFIDSSGLRVFIDLAARIGERSIVFRAASRPVIRLLELTGLESVFTIEPASGPSVD